MVEYLNVPDKSVENHWKRRRSVYESDEIQSHDIWDMRQLMANRDRCSVRSVLDNFKECCTTVLTVVINKPWHTVHLPIAAD